MRRPISPWADALPRIYISLRNRNRNRDLKPGPTNPYVNDVATAHRGWLLPMGVGSEVVWGNYLHAYIHWRFKHAHHETAGPAVTDIHFN